MNNQKIIIGSLAAIVIIGGIFWVIAGASPFGSHGVNYSYAPAGISFTYPDSYALTQHDSAGRHSIALIDRSFSTTTASEGPPAITVDIFDNPQHLSPTEWVKTSDNSNFKLSPNGVLASSTINGREAVAYVWDGLYRGESFVFTSSSTIAMFSVTYNSPDDKIRADFTKILSTLKLD